MNKKQAILTAGIQLFAEKGFSGTSMSMLAGRTNIAGATIFYHFKTKEELFLAVVREVKDEILSAFDDFSRTASFATGLDAVDGILQFFLDLAEKREVLFLLLHRNHPYRLAEVNPECRKYLEAIYARFVEVLEQGVREGIKDGSIQDGDVRERALLLLAMLDGVIRFRTYELYNTGTIHTNLMNMCNRMLKHP